LSEENLCRAGNLDALSDSLVLGWTVKRVRDFVPDGIKAMDTSGLFVNRQAL
jgi:hypothetical protein